VYFKISNQNVYSNTTNLDQFSFQQQKKSPIRFPSHEAHSTILFPCTHQHSFYASNTKLMCRCWPRQKHTNIHQLKLSNQVQPRHNLKTAAHAILQNGLCVRQVATTSKPSALLQSFVFNQQQRSQVGVNLLSTAADDCFNFFASHSFGRFSVHRQKETREKRVCKNKKKKLRIRWTCAANINVLKFSNSSKQIYVSTM